MSLSPNNPGARQPIYSLRYGATRLTKVAENSQDIATTATPTPVEKRSSVSYRKRLSGHLTRFASLKGDRRSTNMSGAPSSFLNQQGSTRKPLSSPITGSPETKRLYPSSSLLDDPNSFLNPRPAPKPPVYANKQSGNTISGGSAQSEGFNGTILTSALDSKEVQEASLMALQLAAERPREAAAVRRAAEAARSASAAAEQARDAAAVAGVAAVKAEEAAVAARREVAYLVRLLRGQA